MNNNVNPVVNTMPAQQPVPFPQPVPVPVYQPKAYKPLNKRDFVFIALYLVASFLMISFGLFGGFHLGFSIAYIVLFCITTAYLIKKGNKPSIFSVLCGALSLAGAVTFTLYNDYFINTIMIILIAGLFAVYSLGLSNSFNHKVGSYRMLIDLVKETFVHPFSNLSDVFGGIKASAAGGKKSFGGLIGVAVAIPFVLVLGSLLMSSDAAFEGLVSKMFKDIGIYLLELILAVAVLPYMYTKGYSRRNNLNKIIIKSGTKRSGIPSSACTSFLAVISLLYIVYLFSQLAYFFSAFKGILPAGYEYTASEFARRGFFEMFAICCINILLISVASAFSKSKTLAQKLLSCFISLFSVLLIVTALQKMKLNVSIYGLSKNRIMVTVFMIMMLVVIAFFIIHIFAPKISYMQPIILICSAMFIALSFANVDARIAQYNISAYESGKIESLDVDTIGDLSDSAVPYLVELTENKDEEISKAALRICAQLCADNYKTYFDDVKNNDKSFEEYVMARENAVKALKNSKRANDIKKTSNYYKNDSFYYDAEGDCFDYYGAEEGWHEYHYNPKTKLYDKLVKCKDDTVFEEKV